MFDERKNVRIAQIGVGPAGTGLWLAAERIKKLPELVTQGLMIFDKAPRSDVGVGYLKEFSTVLTNSQRGDLVMCVSSSTQDALFATATGRQIPGQEDKPLLLRETVKLQAEKGKILREMFKGNIKNDTEVAGIVEANHRGGKTYFTIDDQKNTLSHSDFVIISTGAQERYDPELTRQFGEKTILSKDILGNGSKDISLADYRRIAVIGGSHSGALVIQAILNQTASKIDLIHRGELYIHSRSEAEALTRGLSVTDSALLDDPEGKQPWRFKGTRGIAGDVLAAISRKDEPRVTRFDGSFTQFPQVLDRADLIIQCTGLSWNSVRFYRESIRDIHSFTDIGLLQKANKVVINADGNPFTSIKEYGEHTPLKQIFIVGMGSVGITPEVENYQAINFYEGIMGERRARRILTALDEVPQLVVKYPDQTNYQNFTRIEPFLVSPHRLVYQSRAIG